MTSFICNLHPPFLLTLCLTPAYHVVLPLLDVRRDNDTAFSDSNYQPAEQHWYVALSPAFLVPYICTTIVILLFGRSACNCQKPSM
jgi:hypothetical protein